MYNENLETNVREINHRKTPKEKGPRKVFAIIGMILAIISIVFAFISLLTVNGVDYEGYLAYMRLYGDTIQRIYVITLHYFKAPIIAIGLVYSCGLPGFVLSILGRTSINHRNKAVAGIIIAPLAMTLANVAYMNLFAILVELFSQA